jgi:hypothetical protein
MKSTHPKQPLFLSIIMTTILFTSLRAVTAFQVPTSRLFTSAAAYGRSTFRHVGVSSPTSKFMTNEPSEPSSSPTPDSFKFQNPNNLDDQVFSALSADGGLKISVCTIRNLLNEMMLQHSLSPVAADALGRATMCALLASNGMQEEQMFQLSVKGDGALKGCTVIVTGTGGAKGFVGNPGLGDVFTLKEVIGSGTIQVSSLGCDI